MDEDSFLLEATGKLASQSGVIFNTFITVMFASFAFATAQPLKDIGKPVVIFDRLPLGSSSSLLMGFSILAFYAISFWAFRDCTNRAKTIFKDLHSRAENGSAIKMALKPGVEIRGWDLPCIGFIIGAVVAWIIFMWVTNVERT